MKPRYTDGRYPNGYRKSDNTDITVTWARARKRIEEEKAKRASVVQQLKTIPRKATNGQ